MTNGSNLPRNIMLTVAGSILAGIGGLLLFSPQLMYSSYGITLPGNPSMLSEIRAPGALLLASGLLMLCALFRQQLAAPALALGALVYLAHAVGRLAGIALDGVPATELIQAGALEAVVGAGCVSAYLLPADDKRRATSPTLNRQAPRA